MPSASSSSAPSTEPVDAASIERIRAFNRFYTQRIGVLDPYLGSALSLTEVRVLYELAQPRAGDDLTAKQLCEMLSLDAGHASRVLRKFVGKGWLRKKPDAQDARSQRLQLTALGRKAFAPLQKRSQQEAADLLAPLEPEARMRLLSAMQAVQQELHEPDNRPRTISLREPRPGDMGWVAQQHGLIYHREYGWNWEFEGLVAGICADFVKDFQPGWERGWIAEVDGERVGSVFVVKLDEQTAKLRMLILTPQARGLGLGGRLTDECIAFARAKGYKKMVLWTNAHLLAARAIYAKRGFVLTGSEAMVAYGGHELVSETWELTL